ncbi:Ankyrin repeat and KH domain-containing protein mask [Gryllus bimaculatus]|nr:Ankyrin repeat and KH domain-containing protein mask [Gryllus bimaculatus]
MAATEVQSKKKCVCSERMAQLEDAVKELNSRLSVVEECLLGMDSMRGRMFQLEKSMENALDRIMPRLDALLAGLPASATSQIASKPPLFPPYPNPSSPTRATASSPSASSTSQPAARAKPGSGMPCSGCHSKAACACPKNTSLADAGPVKNGLSAASANTSSGAASVTERASSKEKVVLAEKPAPVAAPADLSVHILELERQLRAAAGRGDVVLCQKIMMSGDTALHCAARGGHLGCIMLLLAVAKNLVISANKQRQTPLMLAAANGHVASVQLLLHQGKAWTNRQGGSKALKQAVTDKRDDVLQALLEGGVNANAEDGSSGPNPLQLAASSGHVSSLQLLLEHGADIGQINGEGQTALHKAALNGHSECIAALLAAGANPLVKDASGWEPLHLAARAGHIECVKLLLASGVDVNRPAANGQTPLVCATNECPEVEEVLRAAGAAVEPVARDSL